MKIQSNGNYSTFFTLSLVLLMFFTVVINHYWRWPLYQKGINIIYNFQTMESFVFDWLFLMVTMIIDPSIIMVITIIIMIGSRRKARAYILLMFILFNTFLTGILKAADCDPRPFWTDQKVSNIGFYCPRQYGNPSGHSWFSPVLGFGFLLDYYGVGKNYKNLIIALGLFILVPLSRMYLGAHSLNQVLEGLTLGCIMNILYIQGLKEKLYEFLSTFNDQMKWKFIIIVCHVCYCITFFMNIGDQIPDKWIKNIKNKCDKDIDEEHLNFLMLMINSLLVNIATGLGLGFSSIEKFKMGKNYLKGNLAINQQKYQWIMGYFLYILIELGCLICGLVGGIAIASIYPTNLTIFISMNLGAIVSGYVYTTKTIRVLEYYKVIKERE